MEQVNDTHIDHEELGRERWELLEHINRLTEKPLIALGFVWLALLIIDFTSGLSPLLQTVQNIIWALFVLDFVIEIIIAPHKLQYLRRNFLTALSLVLPAFRIFRVFRAFRVLRAARAARTVNLLRTVTSLNRGLRATTATLGRRGIGYLIAFTVIVIFAGGAAMAAFESPTALQSEGQNSDNALNSYGEAVWWTAMVVTTLGSEYWPQTVEGRILCWLLSLYAVGVFGYITASVASHFIGQDRAEKEDVSRQRLETEIVALRKDLATLMQQIETQKRD
jgi:voltage-gated potassium channel